MSILDELLSDIHKLPEDEQLRIICDQITKEEISNVDEYEGPVGANIFLSLDVNIENDIKHDNYICLEREAAGAFIISSWCCLIDKKPKRVKAWNVKQTTPKKILKEFAEKMSFLKGE